jgi:hypothetical protein
MSAASGVNPNDDLVDTEKEEFAERCARAMRSLLSTTCKNAQGGTSSYSKTLVGGCGGYCSTVAPDDIAEVKECIAAEVSKSWPVSDGDGDSRVTVAELFEFVACNKASIAAGDPDVLRLGGGRSVQEAVEAHQPSHGQRRQEEVNTVFLHGILACVAQLVVDDAEERGLRGITAGLRCTMVGGLAPDRLMLIRALRPLFRYEFIEAADARESGL